MEKDFNDNEAIDGLAGYNKGVIPPELEDKTVHSLKNHGLIKNTIPNKNLVKFALSLSFIVVIFFLGWLSGKPGTHKNPATSDTQIVHEFLLLLYNSPGFVESETHVKEYGDWMRALIKNDHIASGEKLKETGWQISEPGNALQVNNHPLITDKGRISGFFLIKAEDDKKALEIALSCPHIKYNGMIELRPIQSN